MKHLILFLSAALALSACDSATGSGEAVDIPTVRIDCTSSKCTGITGARDATVILSLSGCKASQITYELVATGPVSAICTPTGCTGTVNSWTNVNNEAIASIESRSYYVCGWIDIDNNANPESPDDAFSEELRTVTGSTMTLTDWSVTYSSRKIRPHR